MNQWTFGWTAIVAIGQILVVGFTAAAVWLAIRPQMKRIIINLIYENDMYGVKKEAILITNQCTHTITLTELGIYLNYHKVDITEYKIVFEDIPLTIHATSQIKVVKATMSENCIHSLGIYDVLAYCMLGKQNPYQKEKDNPKVYMVAKDTFGKEYKHFIGRRKEILNQHRK